MTDTVVNGRWHLDLPDHRALLPSWPWWERERLHAMWSHIRPGDVVYDIGAEQGDLSALYASWGASMVLAEPQARAWPNIRDCFDRNGLPAPLYSWPGFVGDPDEGSVGFVTQGWPTWAYDLDVVAEPGFVHLNEQPTDGGIATISIDSMVQVDIPIPTVITMDVEGAELEVLKGAAGTLYGLRPTVFVSVHPQFMWDRYGQTSDDLLVLMTHHLNYEAHHLGTDHEQHWMFRPMPTKP